MQTTTKLTPTVAGNSPTPEPLPVTAKCACGASFSYVPVTLFGRSVFERKLCDKCQTQNDETLAETEKIKLAGATEEKWQEICPPLYRDTDPALISCVAARAANDWNPKGESGMGFTGETGKGKTRALFLALRKAFELGRGCYAISHNKFSKTVQEAFSGEGVERGDARAILRKCQNVGVLLMDDLGKPPPTERADAELEEMIEHRAAHKLPILWSANGSSVWLEKRLGPDRGPALVRRLSQFSKPVSI